MAGEPFKVGRFAHTLRVRLMREHLGIDVDSLDEDDLMTNDPVQPEHMDNKWNPEAEHTYGRDEDVAHIRRRRDPTYTVPRDISDGVNQGDFIFFILHTEFSLLL